MGVSKLSKQIVSDTRSYTAFIICIAIWALTYHAGISSVAEAWLDNGAYSHGFLAFGFSLYIAWQQRSKIKVTNKTNVLSISLLLLTSLLWWAGSVANVLKIEQFATFLILIICFTAIGGIKILKTLFFPLVIVFLVMPIWDFLQKPLQDLSTIVSYQALLSLSVPTLLEGHQITVPGGRFIVEEACSGLGFFLTALMLTVFYSYLNHLSLIQALKLAAIAITIAILANWVRIISILLVGNYVGMDHFIVTDHLTFGWVVFSFALIPFFMISNRWFPHNSANQQVKEVVVESPGKDLPSAKLVPTIVLTMVFVPVVSWVQSTTLSESDLNSRITVPNLSKELIVLKEGKVTWFPDFPGADESKVVKYVYKDNVYQVLIVHYRSQEHGRELINVNNQLYSQRWNELGEKSNSLSYGQDNEVLIKSLSGGYDQKRKIAYWYIIGGETTTSVLLAKAYEIYSALMGRSGAVLIAVATDNATNPEGLLQVTQLFYQWSDRQL